MNNMKQPHLNISRRSFLYGGAAVLAAGGLGLAGCGKSDGNVDPTTAKIRAALAYSTTQYDVVGQTNALTVAVNWHVYEGLYEIDYHTAEPYPALAKDVPEKIDDKTYRIYLRDNAKFSNGISVTSTDVVSSVGAFKANNTYAPFLDFLKSIQVGDGDNDVIVHLKYPFEDLLMNRLALPKIYNAATDRSPSGSKKVGSGAWIIDEFRGEDGGHVSFSPNSYYNGPKENAQDKMYWNVILDGTARTTAICEKTVNVIENCPDANIENIQKAGATADYKTGLAMCFMFFNTIKKPLDDKRVRQAIMYAIDSQTLIDNQLFGEGKKVSCILPELHPCYHRCSTVYDYNTEKAKSLLKEADQEGMDLELWVAPNWVKDLGPQVKNNLDAIGIKCKIRSEAIAWDSISKSDEEPPFDVLLTPADPSTYGTDPDLIMNLWWGDNIYTNSRSCWAKSPNSRFSELQNLLVEARSAEGTEQQEIWNKCYDLIADECSIYPILHRRIPTGYYPEQLENYKPIGSTGLNFLGVTSA